MQCWASADGLARRVYMPSELLAANLSDGIGARRRYVPEHNRGLVKTIQVRRIGP